MVKSRLNLRIFWMKMMMKELDLGKFPKIQTPVTTTARVQTLLTVLSIFRFKNNGPLLLDASQDKFLKITIHAMIIVKVLML